MAEKDQKDSAKKADESTKKTKQPTKKDAAKKDTASNDQQVEKLQKQVDDLKKQLDAKDDQYLRAEAEIQNMNRHFKDERASLIKYEGQALIKEILPVLDNLQRALSTKAEGDEAKQLHEGIQMVYTHFAHALKNHGVTKIEATGKAFDPQVQQAVQTVPADKDHKADTVVRVLQDGYMLKDRVLPPAMVIVAQ